MKKKIIAAGKFKEQCLRLMDEVARTGQSIIVTKQRKPVAQLMPLEKISTPLFGKFKGSLQINGDIIAPIDENWDACS